MSSTRDMVTKLLYADVPSVVYVAPGGAHAASAGTFIAAAANVVVMAPGTNIGTASPVGIAGEELSDTKKNKAIEDAAAFMRSIASKRGRNLEKLEQTVTEATAYSPQEAVELNIVDFIAVDLEELLQKLDGIHVETVSGFRILRSNDLDVRHIDTSFSERFLLLLSDPNIAFFLLSIGGLGIIIELLSPGLIIPGVVGAICLLMAYLVLGNLPVNWAAVAFIILAIVLLFLEIQMVSFGILGIGAIISFLMGGILLFNRFGDPSPTMTSIGVSPFVLFSTTAFLLIGVSWLIRMAIKSGRYVTHSTVEIVIGQIGIVKTDLDPTGMVQLTDEIWTAVADNYGLINAGDRVKVTGLEGLTLRVSKIV